jgi:pyruvate dehydrogenase E1 component
MSDTREELRRHFEIDKEMIVVGVLDALRKEGKVSAQVLAGAIKDLGVDTEKLDPLHI